MLFLWPDVKHVPVPPPSTHMAVCMLLVKLHMFPVRGHRCPSAHAAGILRLCKLVACGRWFWLCAPKVGTQCVQSMSSGRSKDDASLSGQCLSGLPCLPRQCIAVVSS